MGMSNKILLALQFWDGDKEQAMKNARLIADLQGKPSDQADFLFMARFDCEQDISTVTRVSSKFETHVVTNRRRRGQGWPHGCNDLWFGVMDWVYCQKEAKRIPDYKAVLTFEADAIPLSPNWINQLHAEWDKAKVPVVGALQKSPGPHINGNAMFSGDLKFLHWVSREVGGCTPVGGWDYVLARDFQKRGWADAKSMRSDWQMKTMAPERFEELLKQQVTFHHGCKDDSGIRHVRSRFIS